MKNQLFFIPAFLVFFVMSSRLNAQNTKPAESQQTGTGQETVGFTPGTFVDNDHNGVCDNYEKRSNLGKGGNYTDKNGDGICDWRGSRFGKGRGPANTGKGYGRQGQGRCRGNGNGYCRRTGNK
jgi:hypothetical protein